MNKFNQNFFQILYPFYPLWAWIFLQFLHFPIEKVLVFMLIPSVLYIIWTMRVRFPWYLVFYSLFTCYHFWSVYYWDLLPTNTNWFFYIFSDYNVMGCFLFFILENTNFNDKFIQRMTTSIFVIVMISLAVSLVQSKSEFFFTNLESIDLDDPTSAYLEDKRAASIYSWVSANSVGITFPFLISILISVTQLKSKIFPWFSASGVIVAFLTKARYVMISTIIAFSQLFFGSRLKTKTKFSILIGFIAGIVLIVGVAEMFGYDFQEVINDRIMEKNTDMVSAKARILSYEVFQKKFPEHPYIGVGPKTRADVLDLLGGYAIIIHVGYLSYLYYYGVLGASLLFIALILLLYDSWKVGKQHGFWGAFYGFLGFVLANATFVYFNLSEMGIVLGLIYMRYYKLRYQRLYELETENSDNGAIDLAGGSMN